MSKRQDMNEKPVIAVVGATGAVGETMLDILHERIGKEARVHALASAGSLGKTVTYGRRELDVEVLDDFDFTGVDYALFSAGGSVSAAHAPRACAAGAIVIDNTSQFRYDDAVPLVVPEVNGHQLDALGPGALIANPNCSTIQMVVALAPIHTAVGIERINVATYQAVSGTGKEAIEELAGQTARLLNGQAIDCDVYPKQIAFNALPHIDTFQDNGYTREEMKMVWETRKIFADESIQVNPTCVRIPVFFGHSEAVHIETVDKISAQEATRLLADAPGVTVMDSHKDGGYPTAVTESAGTDPVFVGRIREDISHPRGLDMWIVADNVRKGAALNSVQIAESLVTTYLD